MIWPKSRIPALADALNAWMDAEFPRLRARSQENILEAAKRWAGSLGGTARLQNITLARLRRYLAERIQAGRAPTTIALDRSLLKVFFGWCVREGWLSSSPAEELKGPRVPERPIRVMDHHEQALLMRAAKAFDGEPIEVLVMLAVETGLRERTLVHLQWEHIDLREGWLAIPGSLVKSGRPLRVPLSPTALALLIEWATWTRREGYVFPWQERSRVGARWRKLCKRAGVTGLRFHDLRKTFLTRCRERGVQLEVAMALSDHHDLRTVLRCYRAIGEDDLLKAVGRKPREGTE